MPNGELTLEERQYLDDVSNLLAWQVEKGQLKGDEAVLELSNAYDSLKRLGITPNTLYYDYYQRQKRDRMGEARLALSEIARTGQPYWKPVKVEGGLWKMMQAEPRLPGVAKMPMGGGGLFRDPRELARKEAEFPQKIVPAFYGVTAELGGTQSWKDWFESNYTQLVNRFRAAPLEQIEENWADWLRKQQPRLREEWQTQTPFARGERPAYYAPAIRTVQW